MDTLPLDLDSVLAEPEPDGDPAAGMDVGHVHLKVATVDDAVRWWTDALGLDLMAQLGPQAAFLSTEGYHHDIGANTWMSARGRARAARGPGARRGGARRHRARGGTAHAGRAARRARALTRASYRGRSPRTSAADGGALRGAHRGRLRAGAGRGVTPRISPASRRLHESCPTSSPPCHSRWTMPSSAR